MIDPYITVQYPIGDTTHHFVRPRQNGNCALMRWKASVLICTAIRHHSIGSATTYIFMDGTHMSLPTCVSAFANGHGYLQRRGPSGHANCYNTSLKYNITPRDNNSACTSSLKHARPTFQIRKGSSILTHGKHRHKNGCPAQWYCEFIVATV